MNKKIILLSILSILPATYTVGMSKKNEATASSAAARTESQESSIRSRKSRPQLRIRIPGQDPSLKIIPWRHRGIENVAQLRVKEQLRVINPVPNATAKVMLYDWLKEHKRNIRLFAQHNKQRPQLQMPSKKRQQVRQRNRRGMRPHSSTGRRDLCLEAAFAKIRAAKEKQKLDDFIASLNITITYE